MYAARRHEAPGKDTEEVEEEEEEEEEEEAGRSFKIPLRTPSWYRNSDDISSLAVAG